jgi:hypothetical protein
LTPSSVTIPASGPRTVAFDETGALDIDLARKVDQVFFATGTGTPAIFTLNEPRLMRVQK